MAGSPQSTAHSSATASISKRHKLSNEEAKFNTTIDRISTLPDSLLSHILSFLPIKLAVATSILSTRWKYLWTLVTTLDFGDDEDLPDSVRGDGGMKFAQFVNRVLLLRNSASCIKKFRLPPYATKCISFDFDAWVCATITRDVEELELSGFLLGHSSELPRRLFTCKTLVVLRLRGMLSLDVPSSVYFPSLKILYLEEVHYPVSDSVQKLISGCPILEDLFMIGFDLGDDGIFKICAPSLKNLTLNYEISYSERFLIENLSSLVEANVKVYGVGEDEERYGPNYGNCAFRIIRGLYNVRFLSLSCGMVETLKCASSYDLPMFYNLTKLEFAVWDYNWDVLPNLLESSPNLEVLSLKNLNIISAFGDPCWRQPQLVPKCLSLHLTTIDISGFEGLEGELELVSYILKNARVLKTMKISYCSRRILEEKCILLEKISMLPRGSETCQVKFYWDFFLNGTKEAKMDATHLLDDLLFLANQLAVARLFRCLSNLCRKPMILPFCFNGIIWS